MKIKLTQSELADMQTLAHADAIDLPDPYECIRILAAALLKVVGEASEPETQP